MKTTSVGVVTFLLVASGTSAAWAQNLAGEDDLAGVVASVRSAPGCAAPGLNYVGGGSAAGEAAMGVLPSPVFPIQHEAPMARFMAPTGTATIPGICGNGGFTAEGLVIGLHGVAVVTSKVTSIACGGGLAFSGGFDVTTDGTDSGAPVSCVGCDAGGTTNHYTLSDWKDVLRLIYTGAPHTPNAADRDCNSATRLSLIKRFSAMFQTGCTAGTCPNGLRHAYRRGDIHGVTNLFLASLGAPLAELASPQVARTGAKTNWFCNANPLLAVQPPSDADPTHLGRSYGGASDYLDGDPIKVTCTAGQQTCGGFGITGSPTGRSGVVQVIDIPTNPIPLSTLYPVACTNAVYTGANPRIAGDLAAFPACPNGLPPLLNKCQQPFVRNPDGTVNTFNCMAAGPPNVTQAFMRNGLTDARAYNLMVKDAAGHVLKDAFTWPVNPNTFPATSTALTTRFITGAAFREHVSSVVAGGGGPCATYTNSNDQIGCLSQADPCVYGYAGREATNPAPAPPQPTTVDALTLNDLADSDGNIIKVLNTPPDPTVYPISGKLFLNTTSGFTNLTGDELALARCFATNSVVTPAMAAHHFIPMTATPVGSIYCQDFDETTCVPPAATYASNTDSCASLPPGFIMP